MTQANIFRDVIIAATALVLFIGVHLAFPSSAVGDFVIRAAAMGIFAMSLNLLVGQTGMVSFGHGMFFGLGAYAFVLLMKNTQLSLISAMLLTFAVTAACATIIGLICVKLKEHYFAFCTLAIQMLMYSIVYTAVDLTGGDQGLGGIPRRELLGLDLGQQSGLYIASVTICILSILALRIISHSTFGLSLKMIRDNELRARFLGIPVLKVKLAAFVLASTIASLGGIVMSLFISGAYPELANWTFSGQAIFSIVLGGVNVFLGPLLGSTLLLLLNDMTTRFTDYHGLVLGVIILSFVLGLRTGVADLIVALFTRLRAPVRAASRTVSIGEGNA